tara:strand:- start:1751 stop:2026 length:276 start_codon:yes stop_codon:yes gene_type:complete
MTKRDIVFNLQKLEAQAWVAKEEYSEMFDVESEHFLHLETRWKTLQVVLNASGIMVDLKLRKAIQEQDIKSRNLNSTTGTNNQINVSYIIV